MCGVLVPKHAHVDHIQPRSKAPELALSPSNLQVLCEHCHNSTKRCHEHRETVEHNEDGYPVGSDWAAG
jgi:5-methylcytosine-specific restriction endonuclease McrA